MLRFDKPRLRARCAAPARKPGIIDEIFSAENLAQPVEKVRFGRKNPRKSKEIHLSKTEVLAAKQARTKKTQMASRAHPKATAPA
jgi:hypothetical protein